MVLVEVLMGALRAVEGEEDELARGWGGGDLFIGGVFVGVGDFGGFAEAAYADAEPGGDEDGGYGGGEDVAGGGLVGVWFWGVG